MLKEHTNDERIMIITKQRCVYGMIKAHISKHIFKSAQDIFMPLLVKLRKNGFSNSRQGVILSHSSATNTITKKLKRSWWIVTNMVQRIQDKNPRCTRLLLCMFEQNLSPPKILQKITTWYASSCLLQEEQAPQGQSTTHKASMLFPYFANRLPSQEWWWYFS